MTIPESEDIVLNFDGWKSRQNADAQRDIDTYLSFLPEADREAGKMRFAARYAVARMEGRDPQEVHENWDWARGGFAENRGGEWNEVKHDDQAFIGLLKQKLTQRRDERWLLRGLDDDSAPNAKESRENALMNRLLTAAVLNGSAIDVFSTWQAEAQSKPGYDPARADLYLRESRRFFNETQARVAPVMPLAQEAFDAISSGRDLEETSEAIYAHLGKLGDGPRRQFLAAVSIMASAAPEQQQATFWGNVAKATKRDLARQGRGAADILSFIGGAHAVDAAVEADAHVKEGFLKETLQEQGQALAEHNLESDLRRIQQQTYSPIRDVFPEGALRVVEHGLYAAPGAVSSTMVAAVPYVGLPAAWGMMASDAYESERFRLLDAGMTDAEASTAAATLAPVIAAPQAVLEKVGSAALLNRLPYFRTAMIKVGDRLGGGAAAYGARVAGGSLVELTTERAQDLMQPIVEAAAAGLDKDLPGVTWRNGRDGVLDGWWAQTGETFVALLPLALVGAAASGNSRIDALTKASDVELRALGALMPDITAFREATKKGVASAAEAAERMFSNRKADSAEAKAAVAEMRSEATTRAQASAAIDDADMRDLGLKVTRAGSGWWVQMGDKSIQVNSAEAATRIKDDLKQSATKAEADGLVALIDQWHAATPEGATRETTLTGESARSDGESIVYSRGGEIVREIETPAALDALREEARMDAEASGGGAIDVAVNGSNEVFRDRVANGAEQLVQRLEINQSESAVLTFLHESVEADWRAGVSSGAITAEETQRAIAGLAKAFDPAKAADDSDRAFRERVQRVASGKASQTELRETLSELAVADVLGRRRDGAAMPAGSVTAALDAAVRDTIDREAARELGKLRAFMRAVRQYFRALFGSVAAIKKARRDGGAQEFDALIAKITGRSEQVAFDAGRVAESEEILSEEGVDYVPPTEAEMEDGIAFSLRVVKRSPLDERIARYDALQGQIPDTGSFPAIKLKTGHLLTTSGYPTHQSYIEAKGIDPEDIESGGWISDGDYSSSERSDTVAWKERALAARRVEERRGGMSFSLSPSTPERDARKLAPVQIPSSALEGNSKDWRIAVRSFISSNLQGKALRNLDTGLDITFNAESRSEAVSKLRKEPQFRAAMQVVPIVEQSILLGSLPPAEKRANDTERFHYFAVPVEVDGHSAVAWFNARKQLRGDNVVFYEFGLFDPKETAQMSPGLGAEVSQPNTPTFGPQETVGSFLGKIKDALPAAIKVDQAPTFRVSAGARVEAMQQRIDAALSRDPEARRRIARRAIDKLQTLQFNMETLRQTPQGEDIRPVIERRSVGELNKEQAMRQALRHEELLAEGMGTLTPAAVQALEEGGRKMKDGFLVGAMLSEVGRLMSKSEATRRGRQSEYDDAPWLPVYLWGGSIMPDEAAQTLHDLGLLREPTPDALWRALGNEVEAAREANKTFAQASRTLEGIEQKARQQAKAEAEQWRKEQDAMQRKDWSPRAALLRDMRALDAILSVLPAELRGKVGGYTKLATLGSEKARLKELGRRIDKLSGLLEKHLKAESTEALEELIAKAKPTGGPGQRAGGKIGVEGHRVFAQVERVWQMTKEEADKERDALMKAIEIAAADSKPGHVNESLVDLLERQQLVDLFAAFKEKTAAEMDRAVIWLEQVYQTGRNAWREAEAMRAAEVAEMQAEIIGAMGQNADSLANRQAQKEAESRIGKLIENGTLDLLSFVQVLESLLSPGHSLVKRWNLAARRGTAGKTDAILSANARFSSALKSAVGGSKLEQQRRLSAMATEHKVAISKREGVGGETIQIPREKVAQFKDGSADPSAFGITAEEAADLVAELENPDNDRKKLLTVERVNPGEVVSAKLTEMQAIALTMLARQEQYGENMARHGFTAEVIEEAEKGISHAGKGLREFFASEYRDGYGPLARLFREMFGIDLPQIANYSPASFIHAGKERDVDPFGGGLIENGGFRAGFLKERKAHLAEPNLENAYAVWRGHTAQIEHWKAFAPLVRELRGVFGNVDVKNAIRGAKGSEMVGALDRWMEALENNGLQERTLSRALDGWFREVGRRQATLTLAWKAGTLLKQSLAVISSAARVPGGAWLRGFARVMSGKVDTSAIRNSQMIQRRIESGYSPEVRAAMASLFEGRPTAWRRFVERGMEFIGEADGFFTAIGAAISYDYHLSEGLKSGLSQEAAQAQALVEAEDNIARTAQPAEMVDRSLLELRMSPLEKLGFMFASEARKATALVISAAQQWRAGKISQGQALQVMAVAWLASGLGSALIGAAWQDAQDDDDDSWLDWEHWNPSDIAAQAALGPLSGIPLLSNLASVLMGFTGGGPFSSVGKGASAGGKLLEGDQVEPVEKTLNRIVSVLNGAAALHGGVEALAVGGNIAKQAFAIADNFLPDTEAEAGRKERAAARREAED